MCTHDEIMTFQTYFYNFWLNIHNDSDDEGEEEEEEDGEDEDTEEEEEDEENCINGIKDEGKGEGSPAKVR